MTTTPHRAGVTVARVFDGRHIPRGVGTPDQPALNLECAVSRLSEILKAENAALAAMDFAGEGALLAAKHTEADALAAAWRSADSTTIPADTLQCLGTLADENRELLKRAMRVQRRILDIVARAARTATPATRYAAGGKASKTPVARTLITGA